MNFIVNLYLHHYLVIHAQQQAPQQQMRAPQTTKNPPFPVAAPAINRIIPNKKGPHAKRITSNSVSIYLAPLANFMFV